MNLHGVKQTKEAKEKYQHPIIDILLDRVDKQTLKDVLHCGEREARMIVQECAMYYPVISLSSQRGYRRACDIEEVPVEKIEEDIMDVKKQLKEYNNRIKMLKKRMKPLIAWLKVAEAKIE